MRNAERWSVPRRYESGTAEKAARGRILVVDDDPSLGAAVANALRADGYSVVQTSDEGAALAWLAFGSLAGKRHGGFDLLVASPRCVGPTFETMRRSHLNAPPIVTVATTSALDALRAEIATVLAAARDDSEDSEREDPILEVVATRESPLDAFALKTLLEEHGVRAFTCARVDRARIDVLVLACDFDRAQEIVTLAQNHFISG